ncbi:MAG: DsrE family protein [Hyphomicrobiales bacterium]|nr:DsrE family protein [Hyphomicrobiales bacterium]
MLKMNTLRLSLLACFAAAMVATGARAATMEDLGGVSEAKTVWDVTTGDEARFNDRMGLIKQTADGLRSKGIEPKFVVLIHGKASKFATKSLAGTKFEKAPVKDMGKAQGQLKSLTDIGIPVRLCGIAMSRTKIKSDNVIEYVTQVDNVFENLIALQNKGYAYMEVE